MKGILGYVGLSVGSALGWWLGSLHGITLAVILSAVGSGVGLFYTRWLCQRYLE